MSARSTEFDEILQSAVDEALSTLGESVKETIYFHLQKNFNVPRENVSENLEDFQFGLEKIFGAGAGYLEILIMKNLHAKIGLSLEIEGGELEFVNYVNAAEARYIKTHPAINGRKLLKSTSLEFRVFHDATGEEKRNAVQEVQQPRGSKI